MNRTLELIWYWALVILPLTAILTFVLTLVICSQILNNPRPGGQLPPISSLGLDSAYPYFVAGFVVLCVHMILAFIGRLQFLLRSQSIIHRVILYIICVTGFISCVFLLIMAISNTYNNIRLHITGVIGMFSCLSTYCFLDTIVIIYLFIKRSDAPQYSNILWPLWFIVCSILLIIFAIVWAVKHYAILQYFAAGTPFLYMVGFALQFWRQAKMGRQDAVVSSTIRYSNDTRL